MRIVWLSNKFYDAINATLTLPKNEAFELAARRKGQTFQTRLDAESNQAMFEIAETFMIPKIMIMRLNFSTGYGDLINYRDLTVRW